LQANEPSTVTYQDGHNAIRTPDSCAFVTVNFSNEGLTIPNATVLGVAEETTEELVGRFNAGDKPKCSLLNNQQRKKGNEASYQKLLQGKLDYLSEKERRLIEPVLLEYAYAFHDEETNDFKCTDTKEHQILIRDRRPIRRPQ
jgi:hypothetical protein